MLLVGCASAPRTPPGGSSATPTVWVRPSDGALDERQVTWSLLELATLRERVRAESDWLAGIGAPITDLDASTDTNRVELLVASRDPTVVAEIERHFGDPAWLSVAIDGVGVWNGPRGALKLQVVLESGDPVPFVDCVPEPDDSAAYGDARATTNADGVCRLEDLGATEYMVTIEATNEQENGAVPIGDVRARIEGGRETTATVIVDEPPQPIPRPTTWADESRE